MFTANYLSSEHRYRELDTCFNKPKGKKSSCSPFLTMNSYPNLKKIGVKDCVFTTKQDDICYYNHQCFMPGGLMLDEIIMNLFINTVEKWE